MKVHSLTVVKNPLLIPQVVRAKRHGIVNPLRAYNAAKKQGLDFPLACAILMRETSGGQNVFGHDPTIFVGAGIVTKAKYLAYRVLRNRTHRDQGVGPCQLTSAGLQDEADKLGGCWDVYCNMRVGFKFLHDLIVKHNGNMHDAIRSYNGSGEAAEEYATSVMLSRKNWQNILNGKAGALK